MSITSSKTSFGTQFKAHIVANRVARHLRLKKFGNKQKKEKVVQSILTSTVSSEKHIGFSYKNIFFQKIKNRSRWLYAELNSKYNHRDRIFENFPRFLQMAGSD